MSPWLEEAGAAGTPAGEIAGWVEVLEEPGLGYLSMDCPASTLPTGEFQRIRPATQFGKRLFGSEAQRIKRATEL